MRRRRLERELTVIGWQLKRHGGNHDIWTDGQRTLTVPRHREVDEEVARAILKDAARAHADRRGTADSLFDDVTSGSIS